MVIYNYRYHFALAQPYSFSRYNAYADGILSKFEFVKSEVLAKTVQGRDVALLTITHPKNLSSPEAGPDECEARAVEEAEEEAEEARPPSSCAASSSHSKSTSAARGAAASGKVPVVFLMGRVRAGDSPVSFVIQVRRG